MFNKTKKHELPINSPAHDQLDEPTPVGDLLEQYLAHDIRQHLYASRAEDAHEAVDTYEFEANTQMADANKPGMNRLRRRVNRKLGRLAQFR